MAFEDSDGSAARSGRPVRRLFTALVVLAMLSPLVADRDGLPLSTYPMYAGTRSEVLTLVVASGVASDGEPVGLSMPEIAETRDPLIAQSFLNDALSTDSLNVVCREILERSREVIELVEIAFETRNTVDHVRGEPSLLERAVVARCGPRP